MTRKKIWLLCFICFGLFFFLGLDIRFARAQQEEESIKSIGALVKSGQIDLASRKIDEYLGERPNDPDGLMMKGVVVLSQRLAASPGNFTYMDESIYHPVNGLFYAGFRLIPPKVAYEVANYWMEGLKADRSREDLWESLCYLYAQAAMKPELISAITEMKAQFPGNRELKYRMCDFARMLAERNALADSLEIYQVINNLYPHDSGVMNDWAQTLACQGQLSQSQALLKEALALPHPEPELYQTEFLLYSLIGDYSKALQALQSYEGLTHKRDAQFYKGLLLYMNNNPQGQKELKGFLSTSLENVDPVNRKIAVFLVSKENKQDFASYRKSLTFKHYDPYTLLLHKRAMSRFASQAEPFLHYAEFHSYYKNYREALRIYQYLESKGIVVPSEMETYYFHYAWILQDSGNVAEANQKWMKLFNAKNFYIKSGAIYFYAKNLLGSGNTAEAMKFFRMVAPEAAKSKYAFYCQVLEQEAESDTGNL